MVPPIPTDLTTAQVLPKNFLRPCLLLLLREQPAHGYDLLERLRPLGFSRDDPGRLYRALRTLESDGLVRSVWEKSSTGPDRRMYEITRSGMEELHGAAKALMATDEVLGVFLSRYSEFVALERPQRAVQPARIVAAEAQGAQPLE
ncbi:MAG TPA: helix-turn-helix transcriptional regulator, partial [Thermoleophilaceae bacterium]|nr:helix-turn-helix transcriptional regulator [Thermoleophilaceae bacterium]